MIATLVWLLVVVAVMAAVWWGINQLPLPPIAKTMITVLLIIIAIVVVGKILMAVVGAPPGF